MTIHILLGDELFTGQVDYNFNQVANVIILRFDKPLIREISDFVLTLDPITYEWGDIENLKVNNPELFEQIIYKLRYLMIECEKQLTERRSMGRSFKPPFFLTPVEIPC